MMMITRMWKVQSNTNFTKYLQKLALVNSLHLSVVIAEGQCGVTDTTTGTETSISHLHETLKHRVTKVFIRHIFELIDVEIDICVLKIEEANGCIDENDGKQEQCGH